MWQRRGQRALLVVVISSFVQTEEDCLDLFKNSRRRVRILHSGVNLAHCC